MGVQATDILLKTMIEGALADLRKNNWILDDIYADLALDPLAKMDYGWKEVMRAKEWFLGNNIDVYLTNRVDTPRFPCISVVRLSSREMTERDELGDGLDDSEIVPHNITALPQQMYGPFTAVAYDPSTGTLTLPSNLTTSRMFVGQFLVSKVSGKAYVINTVSGQSTFTIAEGTVDDFTQAYIAPPTALWNLSKERTWLEETFAIGMHTESDMNQAIWMRQLIQYIFLRYKEAYIERRGVALSTFNVGSIDINPHFNGTEMVYSCMMTFTGQVEANFIKYAAPKLQGFKVDTYVLNGPKTPAAYLKYAEAQGWQMQGDEPAKKPQPPKRPDPLSEDEE